MNIFFLFPDIKTNDMIQSYNSKYLKLSNIIKIIVYLGLIIHFFQSILMFSRYISFFVKVYIPFRLIHTSRVSLLSDQ